MLQNLGFTYLGVVPVRKEPNSYSEQITQLLFGDLVVILEKTSIGNKSTDSWLRIRNIADDYEGWIDERNTLIINDSNNITENNYNTYSNYIISSPIAKIKMDEDIITIPMATKLPDKKFTINGHHFTLIEGNVIHKTKLNPLLINAIALLYLNTPYQWGGKNIFGLDCSGFTQNVFAFAGINLKRDAYQQATQGQRVSFGEIQNSDLCFFDNSEGKITHVGIYLGESKIIHCSGKVRIDNINENGIIIKDSENSYSHHLCKIQRLF